MGSYPSVEAVLSSKVEIDPVEIDPVEIILEEFDLGEHVVAVAVADVAAVVEEYHGIVLHHRYQWMLFYLIDQA